MSKIYQYCIYEFRGGGGMGGHAWSTVHFLFIIQNNRKSTRDVLEKVKSE